MAISKLAKRIIEAADVGQTQFYANVKALADALGYNLKYGKLEKKSR